MASIPITIQGVMFYTGLEVGGGPMPGGPGQSPGQPPTIWPSPGVPTHPIYNPPGIWGPTDPRPTPPIYMPPGGGGGQPPLGIWGPPQMPPGFWGGGMGPGVTPQPPGGGAPPQPTHPIVLPPVEPGGPPVTIWPSPGHPSHPIVLPPLPEAPPDTGEGGGKPPPADGGWGFHPEYGWGYFPVGTPGPKGK